MFRLTLLYFSTAIALTLTACSNPHFFPRLRPLFAGLDETKVPARSRSALAEAKVDFQLAKHGKLPQYARYIGEERYSHTKYYQGRGYKLTMVNESRVVEERIGPKIEIDSSITGGRPYEYDEIDTIND